MSSSVGSLIPNIWKNRIHVPKHQPVPDNLGEPMIPMTRRYKKYPLHVLSNGDPALIVGQTGSKPVIVTLWAMKRYYVLGILYQ